MTHSEIPAVTIRPYAPPDADAVDAVERAAFGQADEANLVARLREEGAVAVELIALAGDAVVGHVLFSELPVLRPGGAIRAAALAPLAVRPEWQRRGIGAGLVRAGLDACRERGFAGVVVLGHPDYYPRFGFSAEAARTLRAPFSGPAFMALEFVPGILAGGGRVRYAAAFGLPPDGP